MTDLQIGDYCLTVSPSPNANWTPNAINQIIQIIDIIDAKRNICYRFLNCNYYPGSYAFYSHGFQKIANKDSHLFRLIYD